MEGYLQSLDTLDSRQFLIAIRKLADSLGFGVDPSPFLGAGVEYVQSRPYVHGEPVRAIDWRVTARTGKYYVKEFETPKRIPVYLLVDTSASMAITSYRKSKYSVGVHIAGGLAFACLDRISPVGIVGVGGRSLRIAPSLSKQQIMEWLHHLRSYRFDEPTQVTRKIREIVPRLKERTLMIVISDLHDGAVVPTIKRMAQQHDCVVLQLRDPAERGLNHGGFLRAREAETGREFVTTGGGGWLDQQRVEREFRRGGVDHLLIDTDRPFAMTMRQFFKARGLLGRGAR